jgi:hypothetical protein
MGQSEKEIEGRILDSLKDGLARLEIQNSPSGAKNLATLLGRHRPTVLHDTNVWNLHPNFHRG